MDPSETREYTEFFTELHNRLRGPKEEQLFATEIPVTIKQKSE